MFELLAASRSGAGSAAALQVFFVLLELAIIAAGIYMFRNREKFFGWKGREGDNYASSQLRMIMVLLVWIHAVIVTGLLIFEIG